MLPKTNPFYEYYIITKILSKNIPIDYLEFIQLGYAFYFKVYHLLLQVSLKMDAYFDNDIGDSHLVQISKLGYY